MIVIDALVSVCELVSHHDLLHSLIASSLGFVVFVSVVSTLYWWLTRSVTALYNKIKFTASCQLFVSICHVSVLQIAESRWPWPVNVYLCCAGFKLTSRFDLWNCCMKYELKSSHSCVTSSKWQTDRSPLINLPKSQLSFPGTTTDCYSNFFASKTA